MKMSSCIKTVLAVAAVLVAAAGALTYIYCRISREKAYKEKWKDYIDCGLA